jgi:hypothetical protein
LPDERLDAYVALRERGELTECELALLRDIEGFRKDGEPRLEPEVVRG